jgi:protein gp37
MSQSKIEWTEKTWNPTTGCSKISPGCANCYAETLSNRLKAMGVEKYKNGFELTVHPLEIEKPYNWKKPSMIFVNSMSDLFHEDIPFRIIKKIFEVMNKCDRHVFQVLTKREGRLLELNERLNWSPNIWMGVSVEDENHISRIDFLRKTDSCVKFISFEPLLEPIQNLNLQNINWVIVGGESGPKARPIRKRWVIDILDQCRKYNVKFFFKQWGGVDKKKNGRELNGKIFNEFPSNDHNQFDLF